LQTDPIARAHARYVERGGDAQVLALLERDARAEVEQALAAANAAPWPDASAAYTDVQTTGAGQWY
jgi:pyruvate dehydrogenase E1 component alpha subunit